MSLNRKSNVALGLAMVIVGGIQAQIPIYQQFLTPAWQGVITSLVGIAMLALRYLESEERKEEREEAALTALQKPVPSDSKPTPGDKP